MTTIAYRNGVIAADTSISCGGSIGSHFLKIARRPDGALAGVAGNAIYGQQFLEWVRGGCQGEPPEAKVDTELLDRGVIFTADGGIEVFEPRGRLTIVGNYYAMGSGRGEALGAMFAGADAIEAIQAAIAHDSDTGGKVTALNHSGTLTLNVPLRAKKEPPRELGRPQGVVVARASLEQDEQARQLVTSGNGRHQP